MKRVVPPRSVIVFKWRVHDCASTGTPTHMRTSFRTITTLFRVAGTAVAAGAAAGMARRRQEVTADLTGRVVLITGGSRGLGFNLAKEYGAAGAHVVICSRTSAQVRAAGEQLAAEGVAVDAYTCDVADQDQVNEMVTKVVTERGRLDIAIANAGTLVIGPVAHMSLDDQHEAMNTMYWGTVHLARASMPYLELAPDGRFVTIGSIGGKLPVPHLMPYVAAKAAAMAYSETLRASWGDRNVKVVTVVPGLMRTGSAPHAAVKGRHAEEYRWFGFLSVAPLISLSAAEARRRIVAAVDRGDAQAVISWPAKVGVKAYGLAPSLITRVTGMGARLLPSPAGHDGDRRTSAAAEGFTVPGLEARSRGSDAASQPKP